MAKTEHYYTKFEADRFYHVYNRSVDRKPMFCNDGNYRFFLEKYDKYLSPVIDTYSYCLLGNHFHLLIKINSEADLTTFQKLSNLKGTTESDLPTFQKLANLEAAPEIDTHEIVRHQFQKFFQSYAMAFNNQQARIGTLFQTPFKRALVENDSYYTTLLYYIHANPQLHGLIDDFRKWRWSSYSRFLVDRSSKLKKEEVLEWFGGKQQFLKYHSQKHDDIKTNDLFFEDD